MTREQAEKWSLPSRETKKSDCRAKNFDGESVELDAIEPEELRGLVQEVIQQHLPDDKFEQLMAEEDEERRLIRKLVDQVAQEAAS